MIDSGTILIIMIVILYGGICITLKTMGNKIIFHFKLAFDIICCFIAWGVSVGKIKYTITWKDDEGKRRKINIG